MKWYRGDRSVPTPAEPVKLPPSPLEGHTAAEGYIADKGLADAANVALYLGQPLLLTGPPGTGKTQFAYSLARELGLGKAIKFETKSTSVARDLFYTYDALGRFHAVQTNRDAVDPIRFVHFNALGLAILLANDPEKVRAYVPAERLHPRARRSVVLVDEIDKAPRDFPNDLLNEIEGMYFKVPELGDVVFEADAALRPILVLTSNSEKNLPDAFLRRCVFYDIPFPEEGEQQRLRDIVFSRLGDAVTRDAALTNEAMELFYRFRSNEARLVKPPSTGELLAWLRVLVANGDQRRLRERTEPEITATLPAILKTDEDRKRAPDIVQAWLKRA